MKGAALDARDTKLKKASSVLSGTHSVVAERDGRVSGVVDTGKASLRR